MVMWVQSSYGERRDERLGFASRRRHLLPGAPPPTPPRRSCGGGVTGFPGRKTAVRAESLQCSLERRERAGGGCGSARGVEDGRGGGGGSGLQLSCPGSGGLRRRQRACVSSRARPPLAALPSSAACALLLLPPRRLSSPGLPPRPAPQSTPLGGLADTCRTLGSPYFCPGHQGF